jgi:hypothetical protein
LRLHLNQQILDIKYVSEFLNYISVTFNRRLTNIGIGNKLNLKLNFSLVSAQNLKGGIHCPCEILVMK